MTNENFYQNYDAADDAYSVSKIRISKVRLMVILHSESERRSEFREFLPNADAGCSRAGSCVGGEIVSKDRYTVILHGTVHSVAS